MTAEQMKKTLEKVLADNKKYMGGVYVSTALVQEMLDRLKATPDPVEVAEIRKRQAALKADHQAPNWPDYGGLRELLIATYADCATLLLAYDAAEKAEANQRTPGTVEVCAHPSCDLAPDEARACEFIRCPIRKGSAP